MDLIQYLHGGKNSKLLYFIKGLSFYITPQFILRNMLKSTLSSLEKREDKEYILERVNYYCKDNNNPYCVIPKKDTKHREPTPGYTTLKNFSIKGNLSTYFFDIFEYTRWFNQSNCMNYILGDVIISPQIPCIVKSRPIDNNVNSILLNLDKVRHFTFLTDKTPFIKKRNILFFRGYIKDKPHRIKFLEMYFNNPMCDLGEVSKEHFKIEWKKDKITLLAHLKYKFILALEGNDVASNLKWIMSSNSVAVMPKPKYETWFMEGKLIPNIHYIEIKSDYSDLQQKLDYYIANPDKAIEITKNANKYVEQFKNKKREKLISILVLEKYFTQTGQNPSL